MKKIAIVSSQRWVGQVLEEQWLQAELKKSGYNADNVAWNDPSISWNKYQAVILRSAWGYHRYLTQFHQWLNTLDQLNIPMYNSTAIVRWNMYKDQQWSFFQQQKLATIPSVFVKKDQILNFSNNTKLEKEQPLESIISSAFDDPETQFVVKPIVSGSGENTYVISNAAESRNNQITMAEGQLALNRIVQENPDHGALIQPFIPEIDQGEHSFVFFDRELSHVILRFPGILGEAKLIHEVNTYSPEMKSLVDQVMLSLADKDILYTRVDVVETANGPLLMELELVEPHLLIRHLSEQRRTEAITMLANCILDRKII